MTHTRKISVIGLGYVGLPVAVAFGNQARVIGFDINQARIQELKDGNDITGEVLPQDLVESDILFTDQIEDLEQADLKWCSHCRQAFGLIRMQMRFYFGDWG